MLLYRLFSQPPMDADGYKKRARKAELYRGWLRLGMKETVWTGGGPGEDERVHLDAREEESQNIVLSLSMAVSG